MIRRLNLSGLSTLLAVATLAAVAADGWELSSSDVRNAYFLGQRRGDQRLAEFLSSYVKTLPASSSGPHVAAIEFSTPYHQVVERSRQAVSGYSSQQAQQAYDANSGRILVTATVNLLPGDVAMLRDRGFWREFDLRLVQADRAINPHRIQGELVYQYGDFGSNQIIGFLLRAEFSTQQVARRPVRVEVITHEQNTVAAQFDLARLK